MKSLIDQKFLINFLFFSLIFITLFIIRFFLSTLFFNNDFYNAQNWVNSMKNFGTLGFYERDFSPWSQANYPPIINLLYIYADLTYHYFFNFLNFINLQASFYKLPSLILETILITYFLIKKQKLFALITLLSPAIFYNTIFWGQTEGAVTSLVFFSLLSLLNSQIIPGLLLFTLAILIKQSALVFLPIIVVILIKKADLLKSILGIWLSVLLILFSFAPFSNDIFISLNFFLNNIGGQTHQHIATANAFNFWYLINQNQIPDNSAFLFLTFSQWGSILAGILMAIITLKLFRIKNPNLSQVLIAAGLINFAAFLFLTRIHERHLFPTLILLLPIILKNKLNLYLYFLMSLISFINLFWVWYYDHSLTATILLSPFTTGLMSYLIISCFGYFLLYFLKSEEEN